MLVAAALLQAYWPLILLAVVTLWLGICFGLSRMGWRAFAERLGTEPLLGSKTMRKRRKAERRSEEMLVEVVQFGRFCTDGQLVKAVLGRGHPPEGDVADAVS
jgi:hypothetical protein